MGISFPSQPLVAIEAPSSGIFMLACGARCTIFCYGERCGRTWTKFAFIIGLKRALLVVATKLVLIFSTMTAFSPFEDVKKEEKIAADTAICRKKKRMAGVRT